MAKKVVRKNFDDPAVNQEGVAIEGTEPEVVADQESKDANYQPEAGSFESTDVAPFTDEEIDEANNVDVDSADGKITVFTDEEIDEMTDPEEIEQTAEDMEREQEAFSARKKRLFAAKRRLRKVNSKRADRKTFAEELSEAEESSIIEDIVAILEDSPEIMTAVADEVDGMEIVDEEPASEKPASEETEEVEETVSTAADEPEESDTAEVTEDVVDEPEEESVDDEDISAFTDEELEEVTEPSEEDIDIEAFTEEQIEEAPETVNEISDKVGSETTSPDEEGHTSYTDEDEYEEEEVTEEVETTDDDTQDEEVVEETEAGRVFNKAYCEDSVKNYRRQMLSEMANRQPKSRNFH